MTGVRCFLAIASGFDRVSLRRYVSSSRPDVIDRDCPGPFSYHNAKRVIVREPSKGEWSELDPDETKDRWPRQCDHCDFLFDDDDEFQVFRETEYTRQDTGEAVFIADRIPGMMWDATWHTRKGADGKSLHVILPNGKEWAIDGRASNCTRPDDRLHRCWIRSGDPPDITVGKTGGNTCGAGAGSIQAGDYHGFLRNGVFS